MTSVSRNLSRPSSRRQFLKSATAVTAAASIRTVRAADSPSIPAGPAVESGQMPHVKLAGHSVSRLILGANPQWGYSHRGKLLSKLMTNWYTPDRVVEVLHHAERCGINTWQSSVSGHFLQDWARYREEGGRMNLILLVHSTSQRWQEVRKQVLPLKPLALVHHGGDTDNLWRRGEVGVIESELKRYHDDGVLAGCSSHRPEVVRHIAEQGWELDFFMTCFFRISMGPDEWKEQHGFTPMHEMYTREMPPRMVDVIRQVEAPCLAFKILAAGRATDQEKGVEEAFRYAFSSIKDSDAVIVGMFPHLTDEIAENANLTIQYARSTTRETLRT